MDQQASDRPAPTPPPEPVGVGLALIAVVVNPSKKVISFWQAVIAARAAELEKRFKEYPSDYEM